MPDALPSWLAGRRREVRALIHSYVAIQTQSPHERAAGPFLHELMCSIGYELVPAGDWECARRHPDWSPHLAGQADNVTWIARTATEPDDTRPEIVVNAHVDVVPASGDQAIDVVEDWVGGRGACDTKANLIMVVEALRCLQALGRLPRYRVRFHLPCYEGSAATARLRSCSTTHRGRAWRVPSALSLDSSPTQAIVGA